jgi:hypothetical protein
MIHYIYDPSTDLLKVFIVDKDGNLLVEWQGSPGECPYLRPVAGSGGN